MVLYMLFQYQKQNSIHIIHCLTRGGGNPKTRLWTTACTKIKFSLYFSCFIYISILWLFLTKSPLVCGWSPVRVRARAFELTQSFSSLGSMLVWFRWYNTHLGKEIFLFFGMKNEMSQFELDIWCEGDVLQGALSIVITMIARLASTNNANIFLLVPFAFSDCSFACHLIKQWAAECNAYFLLCNVCKQTTCILLALLYA